VLGETIHRGAHPRHSGTAATTEQDALPFTGADTIVELAVAVSLIAIGVMLLAAGRRRWRPRAEPPVDPST
jgi:hypothetical protein